MLVSRYQIAIYIDFSKRVSAQRSDRRACKAINVAICEI